MICDVCKNDGSVHFRVTNLQTSNWIFICKYCWPHFAETEGYKYGGTRKEKMRKKKLESSNNDLASLGTD